MSLAWSTRIARCCSWPVEEVLSIYYGKYCSSRNRQRGLFILACYSYIDALLLPIFPSHRSWHLAKASLSLKDRDGHEENASNIKDLFLTIHTRARIPTRIHVIHAISFFINWVTILFLSTAFLKNKFLFRELCSLCASI